MLQKCEGGSIKGYTVAFNYTVNANLLQDETIPKKDRQVRIQSYQ